MEYIEVYFRIKSHSYSHDCGFTDDQQRTAFFEEGTRLFMEAGWDMQEPLRSGVCPTVVSGLERLYLYPMNFSGEVLLDSITQIQELLSQAKTFSCYASDCYKTFVDISDAEYMRRLEAQREAIRQDILDACKTKRRNLYLTGYGVHNSIISKYTVHRIEDRDKRGSLTGPFVSLLFDELVEQGLILLVKTKYGQGFRTATDKDSKQVG